MKLKIELTKPERTLIVAALIAYLGHDKPLDQESVDLLMRLAFADPADDGSEIEILMAKRLAFLANQV